MREYLCENVTSGPLEIYHLATLSDEIEKLTLTTPLYMNMQGDTRVDYWEVNDVSRDSCILLQWPEKSH